jgi:hypothetical protein
MLDTVAASVPSSCRGAPRDRTMGGPCEMIGDVADLRLAPAQSVRRPEEAAECEVGTCRARVASTVRAMLHNEAYVGRWSFNRRQWVKVPGLNKRRPKMKDPKAVMRVVGTQVAGCERGK